MQASTVPVVVAPADAVEDVADVEVEAPPRVVPAEVPPVCVAVPLPDPEVLGPQPTHTITENKEASTRTRRDM